MYFEDLVKRSYIKAEPPNDDEVVLLASGCRPQVDHNLVVSKSDFEAVLMGYRAQDPTSEAILMSIGRKGITLGDPIWDVMLQRESVVDRFAQLCNDEAARTLSSLERNESAGAPEIGWGEKAGAAAEPEPAGWPPSDVVQPEGAQLPDPMSPQPYGEGQGAGYSAFPEAAAEPSALGSEEGSEFGQEPAAEPSAFGFGAPAAEPSGFGQEPSGFGQEPSGFGQEPSGFGQDPSGFGQEPSGSSGFGQEPSGFGQEPAPQPVQCNGEGLYGIPSGPDNLGLYVDNPDRHREYEAVVYPDEEAVAEEAPAPGSSVDTAEEGVEGGYGQPAPEPAQEFGSGEGLGQAASAPYAEGYDQQFGFNPGAGEPLPAEQSFVGGPLPQEGFPNGGSPLDAFAGGPLTGFQQGAEEPFPQEGFQQGFEGAVPQEGFSQGAVGAPPQDASQLNLYRESVFSVGLEQGAVAEGFPQDGFTPGEAAPQEGLQQGDSAFGFDAFAGGLAGGPLEPLGPADQTEQFGAEPAPQPFNSGPQQLYDVPGYVAPPPVEEGAEQRYTTPGAVAGDRMRPGFYAGVGSPADVQGGEINHGGLGNLGQLPSEEGGEGIPPRGTTAEFQTPEPMEDAMVDNVQTQEGFAEGFGFGTEGTAPEGAPGFGNGMFGDGPAEVVPAAFGFPESNLGAVPDPEPVAQPSNNVSEQLQRISGHFDLFHSLVKQYTLGVILASENLTAAEFCDRVVAEFPMFSEQLEESLRTYDQDYDRAACSLVQSLQLEAESAVYSGDEDRAEKCIAPVCKLIYS